jgi:hypothetical protein
MLAPLRGFIDWTRASSFSELLDTMLRQGAVADYPFARDGVQQRSLTEPSATTAAALTNLTQAQVWMECVCAGP